MKKHKFIVEIEIPEGVNITEMKRYIAKAVACECGLLYPEEPLFYTNIKSIKVVHATRTKAAELLSELKTYGRRK